MRFLLRKPERQGFDISAGLFYGPPMIEKYLEHQPRIAEGTFVHQAATVIGDVDLGSQVSIWPNVSLRGDEGNLTIGDRSNIQDGSTVHTTGGMSTVTVEEQVTVGHNVILHGCHVKADTIVGMGSIILDNAVIGKNVIVGAGTLIPMRKEIPDGVLVLGNPYKIVRELTDKDLAFIEFSWRTYVDKAAKYLLAS